MHAGIARVEDRTARDEGIGFDAYSPAHYAAATGIVYDTVAYHGRSRACEIDPQVGGFVYYAMIDLRISAHDINSDGGVPYVGIVDICNSAGLHHDAAVIPCSGRRGIGGYLDVISRISLDHELSTVLNRYISPQTIVAVNVHRGPGLDGQDVSRRYVIFVIDVVGIRGRPVLIA